VPWHDRRWDGYVCNEPLSNAFCVALDRIRENRDDMAEETVKSKHFGKLTQKSFRLGVKG
jgi:hypothetical protein